MGYYGTDEGCKIEEQIIFPNPCLICNAPENLKFSICFSDFVNISLHTGLTANLKCPERGQKRD